MTTVSPDHPADVPLTEPRLLKSDAFMLSAIYGLTSVLATGAPGAALVGESLDDVTCEHLRQASERLRTLALLALNTGDDK